MAKTTVTRKSALVYALALIDYANTEAITLPNFEDVDKLGSAETLGKMLEQIAKPRKATVSKARLMNENLAAKVAEKMGDMEVDSKWVVANFPLEIPSTQKAAAVMRVGMEMGLITKKVEGKKVTYKRV